MNEPKQLSEAERVKTVMVAAGCSPRVAEHYPEKYRQQLAALCSAAGVCVPNVRDKVVSIKRAVGIENKAEIDEPDTEVDE